MLLPSVVSSIINSREPAKIGGNAVVAQWFAHVFCLTMQVPDFSGVAGESSRCGVYSSDYKLVLDYRNL
jgi:hypothetical protein